MGVKIRPAKIGDLKFIQELNQKLFNKDYKESDKTLNCDWPFAKEGEKYFKAVITKEDHCAFIALVKNKIIGYLAGGIEKTNNIRKFPEIAEIENILVLEEFRNMGIGKKLCEAFFDWCRVKNIHMVTVEAYKSNIQGINFYKKTGFKDYTIILEKEL